MRPRTSKDPITARATLSSYFALSGIWVLLSAWNLIHSLRRPGDGSGLAALLTGGIALLWCVWLRGFKITISAGCLEYRDGLFRSSKVSVNEITDIKSKWIGWSVLGRKIKIPRIVVFTQDKKVAIQINPKPFGRLDLHKLLNELDKSQSVTDN